MQIRQYWKLRDREHRENFEETAEIVRFLVTDSIQRQMVSDVPIGTFLSGGLDSSIITAVCAGEKRKKGETLDTFSVDYLNNDQFFVSNKFQPESDSAYIHLMQKEMATFTFSRISLQNAKSEKSTSAIPGRSLAMVASSIPCSKSSGVNIVQW